mmetsp:Transcript_111099/g.309397  ORF Transcript_111099/g.309397 Transcript_111099/m.309397 type:complete len:205 (+) Transcript_111099:51-665(+)
MRMVDATGPRHIGHWAPCAPCRPCKHWKQPHMCPQGTTAVSAGRSMHTTHKPNSSSSDPVPATAALDPNGGAVATGGAATTSAVAGAPGGGHARGSAAGSCTTLPPAWGISSLGSGGALGSGKWVNQSLCADPVAAGAPRSAPHIAHRFSTASPFTCKYVHRQQLQGTAGVAAPCIAGGNAARTGAAAPAARAAGNPACMQEAS